MLQYVIYYKIYAEDALFILLTNIKKHIFHSYPTQWRAVNSVRTITDRLARAAYSWTDPK